MKNRRQGLILSLIKEKQIETQEELTLLIKQSGIETTQATISRDLKELNIEKIAGRDGSSYYAIAVKTNIASETRLARFLEDAVQGVDFADNLVVLKTFAGMGNAAGAAIDGMEWQDIVGTIAGDDTLLIITKSPEKAIEVCKRLESLSSR